MASASNEDASASASASSSKFSKRRTLSNGRTVSSIGIGTMHWGDETQGFGTKYRERDLSEAFEAAMEGGIDFVDTAEVYGAKSSKFEQSSEHIVGRCAAERRNRVSADDDKEAMPAFVGSKVFTVPWTNVVMGGSLRLSTASLVDALKESVKRNQGEPLDLWSIHFPFPTWSQGAIVDALAQGMDLGLCKAVGVSNYNLKQMEEAYELLDARGIPLVTNQVKYSVLERGPEQTGLLKAAEDMGVTIVAYSPMGGGLLQTSADREIRTLNKLLEFIGAVNGGKSSSQVALNYLMCKGAIPVASCTSVERANQYADCLNFELGEEDVATIDEKLDYIDRQSGAR